MVQGPINPAGSPHTSHTIDSVGVQNSKGGHQQVVPKNHIRKNAGQHIEGKKLFERTGQQTAPTTNLSKTRTTEGKSERTTQSIDKDIKSLVETRQLDHAKTALNELKEALENKNSDYKPPKDLVVKIKLENGDVVQLIPLKKGISKLSEKKRDLLLQQITSATGSLDQTLNKPSHSRWKGVNENEMLAKLVEESTALFSKEKKGNKLPSKNDIKAHEKSKWLEIETMRKEDIVIKDSPKEKDKPAPPPSKKNDEDELINTMENVDLAQSAVGAAGSVAKGLLDKN